MPAWLRMLLTPWPWLICLGAAGLVVLVWMIATRGHAPDTATVVQEPRKPIGNPPGDGAAAGDRDVPRPAPVNPPKEVESVAGTVWEGDDGPIAPDISIQFEAGGVLSYSRNGASFRNGTWKQTGDSVYFEMNDKFQECQATIRGDRIEGDSWNVSGEKWKTSLRKKQ